MRRKEMKENLDNLWKQINSIRIDMIHDKSTDWEIEEGILSEVEEMVTKILF